jgi:hypothetical protein
VKGSELDEEAFFRAIEQSGVRALLIDRRALIALGAPVLTADYDLWIHIDDADKLNALAAPFDLVPSRTPEEARRTGRYVLENDERVDVLVARSVPTVDGVTVTFDELWERRTTIPYGSGINIVVPRVEDLILTKRFGGRPKDIQDIEFLQGLLAEKKGGAS